jgi:GNAT superfamily N-acetyltransferase
VRGDAAIRVRRARAGDLGTIHALLAELARYERLARRNRATRATLRRALFGDDAALEGLIAERGGRPVGMALFQVVYSTFGGASGLWIEDLVVLPAERGGGVGRALMARVARAAKARHRSFLAWNVLEWNRPAMRFYRRLGARRISGWIGMWLDGPALARLARVSRARAARPAAGRRRTARRP